MTEPRPFFGSPSAEPEADNFPFGKKSEQSSTPEADPFAFDANSDEDLRNFDIDLEPGADLESLAADGVTEQDLADLLGDVTIENVAPAGPNIRRPFRASDRPPPEVRRFLFDSNFGAPPPPPPPPPVETVEIMPEPELESEPLPEPEPEPPIPPPPTFSQEELNAARAAGYADGEHDGRLSAQSSLESRAATAFEMVSNAIPGLLSDREQIIDGLARDSARLAHAMIEKLLPALSERYGLAEVEAVIADGVARALDEPRLLVRLSPDNAEALEGRIDALVRHSGFEGRVSIIREESLGPADVRVEWGDGGAERITHRVWMEVTSIVDRAIAGLPGSRQTIENQGQAAPTADHRSGAAMGSAA
jgi:flagellar assembly protein FliH